MGKAHSLPFKPDEEEEEPKNNPTLQRAKSMTTSSRVHAAAVSVRRITSPRGPRPHSVEKDRFVEGTTDLPEIDMEELELFENIGWGATGLLKTKKEKKIQNNNKLKQV